MSVPGNWAPELAGGVMMGASAGAVECQRVIIRLTGPSLGVPALVMLLCYTVMLRR